ncbi:MAG: class I SAM-dependent methyltransferase [Chloroflexi bacterium]|nr:class I SAM-dependent methyltransferase [Chloroflexota bacterium]OJV95274.1 MAG: hypothetical protein BGO39_25055 [Chloroflexi bacterium 54-19]
MPTILRDARAEAVLTRLYEISERQEAEEKANPVRNADLPPGPDFESARKKYLSDKLVALEPDKAEFCYLQCRALGAQRIVEIGTSYGVSTIYLAAAIRDNGGKGIVIGTEYEPEKCAAARANWAEAGVSEYIDLREGDLRETIGDTGGPVDFVLMDIWTPMALPALELLIPQLKKGAVIISDNTIFAAKGYAAFLARIKAENSGFRTVTLPFSGGLEYTVWEG